jgi:hypothetical protein
MTDDPVVHPPTLKLPVIWKGDVSETSLNELSVGRVYHPETNKRPWSISAARRRQWSCVFVDICVDIGIDVSINLDASLELVY